MKLIQFENVPVGETIMRIAHKPLPPYVKISNSEEVDIASGRPVGNVAPYASFRAQETCMWLDRRQCAEADEEFKHYQLGKSLQDHAMLYNQQVWLKARVLKKDELDINPFHP